MKMFIFGMLFGIVITTIGFGGIVRVVDKGIETIKTQSVELAK
jgi:hypothetical protein